MTAILIVALVLLAILAFGLVSTVGDVARALGRIADSLERRDRRAEALEGRMFGEGQ
jgi:type II secretory pathway component PulJ